MPGTDRRLEKGTLSLSAEVTVCLFNPSSWTIWNHCSSQCRALEAAASQASAWQLILSFTDWPGLVIQNQSAAPLVALGLFSLLTAHWACLMMYLKDKCADSFQLK